MGKKFLFSAFFITLWFLSSYGQGADCSTAFPATTNTYYSGSVTDVPVAQLC